MFFYKVDLCRKRGHDAVYAVEPSLCPAAPSLGGSAERGSKHVSWGGGRGPPPVHVHKPTGNPLLLCVCKWPPALSARRARGRGCPSAHPRRCGFPDSARPQALPRDRLPLPVCEEAPLPSIIRVYGQERGSHLSAGSALTKPCEPGPCA